MAEKIYFLSDFHFIYDDEKSNIRERNVIRFLDKIKTDATQIFILGDIFDFWYEYKTVVPKGYLHFFAKLLELKSLGIDIQVFTGNHDMWMFGYFEQELNIPVHKEQKEFTFFDTPTLLGHGDGKGPGDVGYKRLKKVFDNTFFQSVFSLLHPDIGNKLAYFWSKKSRDAQVGGHEEVYLGDEKEWLVQYCKRKKETSIIKVFIFGHRHLPLDIDLGDHARYINLGDWINHNTYAVWDASGLFLKKEVY